MGPVLDPVFSLRQRIRVEPGASAALAFTTVSVDGRTVPEGVVELVDDGRQHEVQIVLGS